jgi:hypothetical protein
LRVGADRAILFTSHETRKRGRSSMVERQLPKLHTRVRFPSPAPAFAAAQLRLASQQRRRRALTAPAALRGLRAQAKRDSKSTTEITRFGMIYFSPVLPTMKDT